MIPRSSRLAVGSLILTGSLHLSMEGLYNAGAEPPLEAQAERSRAEAVDGRLQRPWAVLGAYGTTILLHQEFRQRTNNPAGHTWRWVREIRSGVVDPDALHA